MKVIKGIKYLVLKKGDGPKIEKQCKILFHYKGKLEDGSLFGNSYDSSPIDVTVGQENTIRGLEIIFPHMIEGEKAKIIVPPELAYGQTDYPQGFHGAGIRIPPDSILYFEVEIMEVEFPTPENPTVDWVLEDAMKKKKLWKWII